MNGGFMDIYPVQHIIPISPAVMYIALVAIPPALVTVQAAPNGTAMIRPPLLKILLSQRRKGRQEYE